MVDSGRRVSIAEESQPPTLSWNLSHPTVDGRPPCRGWGANVGPEVALQMLSRSLTFFSKPNIPSSFNRFSQDLFSHAAADRFHQPPLSCPPHLFTSFLICSTQNGTHMRSITSTCHVCPIVPCRAAIGKPDLKCIPRGRNTTALSKPG